MAYWPQVCAALPVTDRFPAKPGQHTGDSALFGRSDLRVLKSQGAPGDIGDADAREGSDMRGYRFLPRVCLVSCFLFRLDVHALEVSIWPPFRAGAIGLDGLGEQLVAVVTQRLDIDRANLHRPESAPARLVAQIGRLVSCAYEQALARFDRFLSAVTWPISLHGSRYECLEVLRLGATDRAELRYFDQPLTAQMLGASLSRISGMASENHCCPASTPHAVDLLAPCSPSRTGM